MISNADKLLKEIRSEKISKRKKITLLLDDATYTSFQKVCANEELPASRVTEKLMKDFIQSYSNKKKS